MSSITTSGQHSESGKSMIPECHLILIVDFSFSTDIIQLQADLLITIDVTGGDKIQQPCAGVTCSKIKAI